MRTVHINLLLGAIALVAQAANAAEPNDVFAEATVLPAGTLTVADELTSPPAPDTLLGARGLFGDITQVDDDSSPEGDGRASALYGVPTNSGTVSFAISGFGDDAFVGNHNEFGGYEANVVVYDFFGDPVDDFFVDSVLEPGVVDAYEFSDFNYLNGSYDVVINNTANSGADVDFFTFTGLAPGVDFTAETFDPDLSGVDTYLGWFSLSGALLEEDDDGGEDVLSQISGVVPANGTLTFAVTGYPDQGFEGNHSESGGYELRIDLPSATVPGDYDGDNDADGADLVAWQRGGSPQPVSASDLATWQRNFGTETTPSASPVPEPNALILLIVAFVCRRMQGDGRGRRARTKLSLL